MPSELSPNGMPLSASNRYGGPAGLAVLKYSYGVRFTPPPSAFSRST